MGVLLQGAASTDARKSFRKVRRAGLTINAANAFAAAATGTPSTSQPDSAAEMAPSQPGSTLEDARHAFLTTKKRHGGGVPRGIC